MLGGGGGVRGHAPPEKKVDKYGAIWCNLGALKYVKTNLKIDNSKDIKSTAKLNYHISLLDQLG